jgi:hypothetical protein
VGGLGFFWAWPVLLFGVAVLPKTTPDPFPQRDHFPQRI